RERSTTSGAALPRRYRLGVVNPGGTAATTAFVANCATARFGGGGVVRTRTCSERFALEVDQLLACVLALGLDGGELGLGVGKLGTELHLGGLQVGEQTAQLIALGANGDQVGLKRSEVGLKPRDGRERRIRCRPRIGCRY